MWVCVGVGVGVCVRVCVCVCVGVCVCGLLCTSDAADEERGVDLGGLRTIKKKKSYTSRKKREELSRSEYVR